MKRLKLKHAYHDALIRAIRYRDNADIVFEIDLCSCCNPSACSVTLSLLGLRNFPEVQKVLESARQGNAARGYIDEIVAIVREMNVATSSISRPPVRFAWMLGDCTRHRHVEAEGRIKEASLKGELIGGNANTRETPL